MKTSNPDKEEIIRLVTRWRERSGLSFKQAVARIQARGYDMSEIALRDRLTSRIDRKPDISPELTLAVIAAFTEGLTESERCQAHEALDFARLTRLSIDQLQTLGEFFPEGEFNQAFSHYVLTTPVEKITLPPLATILDFKPRVDVSREGSNRLIPVDFFMPLYQNDVIHTYVSTFATFFCKESKLLFRVPEQNTLIVNCADKTDRRVMGQLDLLLGDDDSKIDRMAETEMSIQNLALSEIARGYLLFQLYREYSKRAAAIEQLEQLAKTKRITSPYLWQQLGDLYFEAALYSKAKENYQAALTATEASEDEQAQAIAHIGLACVAYAFNNVEQVLIHLKSIVASEYLDIVKILLENIGQKVQGQESLTYKGKAILSDYVRFLAENVAPDLMDEFRNIPDLFLERIAALKEQLTLKPEVASSRLSQNKALEAMELLAATYLTTRTLIETLSIADIEMQARTDQLPETLRQQAKKLAQDAVGFDSQRAQAFAEQYAVLVGRDPESLQALMKQ